MASKQLHDRSSSLTSPSTNSSSSPESFALETKFIVLNFMSRNPHERHPGCVYSSTSSAGSDSDPFKFKHRKDHSSFPASPRFRRLGQLDQSFHTSEDNVNYRYQKESKKLQNNDSSNDSFPEPAKAEKPLRASVSDEHLKKRHFKSQSFDHGLSKGRYFLGSDSSPCSEPASHNFTGSTPFENYRQKRTESELSSDAGNLSYTSDADDEYESTASSLINSFTDIYVRGSKHELAVPRLSTLMSESDIETDVSTVACDTSAESNDAKNQPDENVFMMNDRGKDRKNSMDQETQANGDGHHLQPLFEITRTTSPDHSSYTDGDVHVTTSLPSMSSWGTSTVDDNTDSDNVKKKADRSKLRLVIKDQHEWEEEQRYQMQKVLAVVEDEVFSEMVSLESEVEEAIKRNVISPAESPFIAPLSPHSEAAMTLARMGDEIKDHYGDRLQIAVSGLIAEQQTSFTYENFRCMACSVIDQVLPGWRQVALLLVFGQSVAWRVAEFGYREFGELVNNTVRLISELTADFITSQGGWGAVTQYDSSLSSSLSPQPSSEDASPRNTSNQLSPKRKTNSGSLYTSFVIPVHDRPDGVTFDPDESAVDNTVIFENNRRQNLEVTNRSVSLADIEMTFSPSHETADNPMTFSSSHESVDNHGCFSQSHMLQNNQVHFSTSAISTDNYIKILSSHLSSNNDLTYFTSNKSHDNHVDFGSSVDTPVTESSQIDLNYSSHGENNNSLCDIHSEKEKTAPPGEELRNDFKSIRNLSQEDSSLDPLPSNNTYSEGYNSSTENHSNVEVSIPVLQLNDDSISLNSEAQSNISSNNSSSQYARSIVMRTIPTTNIQQHEEEDEELESDDDDSYHDQSDDMNIFNRYFNVGAFLSIGICAIALIATIATGRK